MDGLDARATAVTALSAQIAIVERRGRASSGAAALPFGIEALDQRLPSGGLLLGAMHELQATVARTWRRLPRQPCSPRVCWQDDPAQ